MLNTGFIDDGYTVHRTVSADPQGRFPQITIEYRPLHHKELNAALDEMKEMKDDKDKDAENFADGVIAARVGMWNIKNQDDGVIEITAENVGWLEPLLRMKLWRIIFSSEKETATEKN